VRGDLVELLDELVVVELEGVEVGALPPIAVWSESCSDLKLAHSVGSR